MSTHVEYLVLNMAAVTLTIQVKDMMLESLPWGLLAGGVEFRVGLVASVDQSEIHGGLTSSVS